MSNSLSILHSQLIKSSSKSLYFISRANYTQPQGTNVSTKSLLESLLSKPNTEITDTQLHNSIKDFALACALLSSSQSSTHELLSWVPHDLSLLASSVFYEFSRDYYCRSYFGVRNEKRVSEILGFDCGSVSEQKRLVVELLHEVLPLLKDCIKESCIDKGSDGDEISAASARAPVGFAIVAASLIIPCGLTALDHWSSDVKWMHADDDETVQLVLKQVQTVARLTWIRITPYTERLVSELVVLYKEAALKTAREEIRTNVVEMLVLLQQCKGLQFKSTWDNHSDDPNLTSLISSLRGRSTMSDVTVQADVS